MKVLVLGLGSIARKHIVVLKEIHPDVQIYALRSSRDSKDHPDVINLYDRHSLKDMDFHFAIIASPSSMHLEHIKMLNSLNIPLLIEKPLVISLQQIKSLEETGFRNPFVYVACNLRFHPLIEFLKKFMNDEPRDVYEVTAYFGSYLPNWRPGSDYRKVYSAMKDLGGGVHLDLIHEPDYMVFLFGLPVASFNRQRKVSNLEIDSFDASNTLFEYEGFNAQIIVNYFRKDSKRTLEIVREDDTLLLDFINGEVRELSRGELLFKDENPSVYTTYKKQMAYFLSCIDRNVQPMNSPAEAIEILKCIL